MFFGEGTQAGRLCYEQFGVPNFGFRPAASGVESISDFGFDSDFGFRISDFSPRSFRRMRLDQFHLACRIFTQTQTQAVDQTIDFQLTGISILIQQKNLFLAEPLQKRHAQA